MSKTIDGIYSQAYGSLFLKEKEGGWYFSLMSELSACRDPWEWQEECESEHVSKFLLPVQLIQGGA